MNILRRETIQTSHRTCPDWASSHVITVHVYDSNGQRLSSQKSTIKLSNTDTLELSVTRTEPDNSQQGVEPNAFIALYFNKPIDSSKLQVSVKETVHGQTYDLSAQSGANPMMDGDTCGCPVRASAKCRPTENRCFFKTQHVGSADFCSNFARMSMLLGSHTPKFRQHFAFFTHRRNDFPGQSRKTVIIDCVHRTTASVYGGR